MGLDRIIANALIFQLLLASTAQAGESLFTVTESHFREIDAINTRYNEKARTVADEYQKAKVKSKTHPSSAAAGGTSGTLATDVAAVEAARRRDLAEAESRYAAAKERASLTEGTHAVAPAASNTFGTSTRFDRQPISAGRAVAAPVQSMREEVILDGSSVPREIEFTRNPASANESAPALGNGATHDGGVTTIEF
jgi:hypothetical protein